MLNFSRNDRPDPSREPQPGQRPAASALQAAPSPAAPRVPAPPVAQTAAPAPTAGAPAGNAGSRLSIGPNINLKGVEISNCDVLAIEGNVEATIVSRLMEIAPPGRLNGTATIEVAEVHGEFSGELTVRGTLVVHGTGRVTGTIRYGKLVVAEGGAINGELKQLDSAPKETVAAPLAGGAPRVPLAPQPH